MIIISNTRRRKQKISTDIQPLLSCQNELNVQKLLYFIHSSLFSNSFSGENADRVFFVFMLILHTMFKFQVCNFIANFN